jgi:hypothetical protein
MGRFILIPRLVQYAENDRTHELIIHPESVEKAVVLYRVLQILYPQNIIMVSLIPGTTSPSRHAGKPRKRFLNSWAIFRPLFMN